jgi:hypothetical protein
MVDRYINENKDRVNEDANRGLEDVDPGDITGLCDKSFWCLLVQTRATWNFWVHFL